MNKPYYLAYEARYQKVFAAGVECWGHSPDDETLVSTLGKWVNENNLAGKKIIEFACGEGACGVILSRSGCRYRGVDIAASAIEKAQNRLRGFPDARVGIMDMVKERTNETYDAALDCMGSYAGHGSRRKPTFKRIDSEERSAHAVLPRIVSKPHMAGKSTHTSSGKIRRGL